MRYTVRKQAFLDMIEEGLNISVFTYEKVIIEITRRDDKTSDNEDKKPDFRCFNGGKRDKKKR
jgi:uncharacterized ubiquitin-like protein YukD